MRAARVRTESMAQRLAKKPLSEGFELWDKGYVLGAMRLFIFKAENSPPFQLGPCLDAVGHLLMDLEEYPDAIENLGYAAEKYNLIDQPLLAKLMGVKALEASEGAEAALAKLLADVTAEFDGKPKAEIEALEPKVKSALARALNFRAELLFEIDPAKNAEKALADAELAASLQWDRVFLAHYTIGMVKDFLGDVDGALGAFDECVVLNESFLAGYEAILSLLKKKGDNEKLLEVATHANALHPRADFIRTKAFAMAELGNDAGALKLLNDAIANPPCEETEAILAGGNESSTLLKAKAAILADAGKLEEALEAAQHAVSVGGRNDEEAAHLVEDIKSALAQPVVAAAEGE